MEEKHIKVPMQFLCMTDRIKMRKLSQKLSKMSVEQAVDFLMRKFQDDGRIKDATVDAQARVEIKDFLLNWNR